MADEFVEEWRDKHNTGVYFYQFFEKRTDSTLLYISQYLESVPSFDTRSNYMIVDAKKKNILGDIPVRTHNIFFWIGAQSQNYERNYAIVVECLDVIKGQKNVYIEHQYNESL